MGQWNTLHIIDTDKLQDQVIPSMKNDSAFVEKYVNSAKDKIWSTPTKALKIDMVDKIIAISNQLSDNFKNHPDLKKNDNQIGVVKKYYSPDIENFRIIFHKIVFSECALSYPCFRLGYRLITSCLSYIEEDTISESLVEKLEYNFENGAVFPGEYGIRNWINNDMVNKLLNSSDEIIPNLLPDEFKNDNKYSKIYCAEFKEFIRTASKNGFGLISCLDADFDILKDIKPIGKNIKWEEININKNILFKE